MGPNIMRFTSQCFFSVSSYKLFLCEQLLLSNTQYARGYDNALAFDFSGGGGELVMFRPSEGAVT